MTEHLHYLRDLEWKEVYSVWRSDEVEQIDWKKHWKKKGHSSWDEWRGEEVQLWNLSKLSWKLFDVVDPLVFIPSLRVGPFASWHNYTQIKRPTFQNIIADERLQKNSKVNALVSHFPRDTRIMALRTSESIVCIEGLHRCSAVAYMQLKGVGLESTINLALADFPNEDLLFERLGK